MKYQLNAEVCVSAYTNVEAESEQEAIQIASAREVVIGGIGSSAKKDEQWVIDDADGEALQIRIA